MRFRIVRHKENDFATYGSVFTEHGEALGVTLFNPFVDEDRDGRRDANLGRIQAGIYRAVRAMSPKRHREVWWLCGVPDVTPAEIPGAPDATTSQIHIACFPWDLEGCIGIGTAFGDVEYDGPTVTGGHHPREHGKSYPGITNSTDAFERFMAFTAGVTEITVEIVDNFGAPAGSWA